MNNVVAITQDEGAEALINVEGEYALLSALLNSRPALEAVADRVTADDFAEPVYGRMFAAMVHEISNGRDANAMTLAPIMQGDSGFEELGGRRMLVEMSGSLFSMSDWRGLASDIARFAKRRRLIDAFRQAILIAENPATAEGEMLEAADAAISNAADTRQSERVLSLGECMRAYIDTMDAPSTPGILCGRVSPLDQVMGAIRRTNLIIGAGRPGMGKTAAALSYAVGAAQNGHGVLFISLEMAAEELMERTLADISFDQGQGVPYECIREKTLDVYQKRELCRAYEAQKDLPLHIYDTSGLSIPKLDRIIRRFRRKLEAQGHTLDLVIVDYLQLMTAVTAKNNRVAEVTEISNGLKRLAKAHNVGMFALSQLSREVEKRPDKRPILADLRDSGSIEQDADVVVFFFRLEYYLRAAEPDTYAPEHDEWQRNVDACSGAIDFHCAKRRHGKGNAHRKGSFHAQFQAVR